MSSIYFGTEHHLSRDQQILSHLYEYFRQKKRVWKSRRTITIIEELERILEIVSTSADNGPSVLFSMGILPVSNRSVLVYVGEFSKLIRYTKSGVRFAMRNRQWRLRSFEADEVPDFVRNLPNFKRWSLLEIVEHSGIHRILMRNPSLISPDRPPQKILRPVHGMGLVFCSFLSYDPVEDR
jgi:hypothetical protein